MSSRRTPFHRLEVEDIKDVAVVTFVDKWGIVEPDTCQIDRGIDRLVEDFRRHNVLLDLANLQFMSSSALGRLITLHRKVAAVQGRMVFWNIPPVMQELFRVTRLDRIIPITKHSSLSDVLAERFGVSFLPDPFAPEWRTDTAVLLARQMLTSGNFSAMPILADALQDAGCDNDDILTHCRGPGFHARGCPVIDRVLAGHSSRP